MVYDLKELLQNPSTMAADDIFIDPRTNTGVYVLRGARNMPFHDHKSFLLWNRNALKSVR